MPDELGPVFTFGTIHYFLGRSLATALLTGCGSTVGKILCIKYLGGGAQIYE